VRRHEIAHVERRHVVAPCSIAKAVVRDDADDRAIAVKVLTHGLSRPQVKRPTKTRRSAPRGSAAQTA
jgi:hypothetical protein